jgi:uncharacterized protein
MINPTDDVQTFIVKVASPCNLACTYCYEYVDDEWKKMPKIISQNTISSLCSKIVEYSKDSKQYKFNINAHGGEPMLLGAEGLDNFFSQIKEEIPDSIEISFGLQTNATLASSEIAGVLVKHSVSVGISIDGDSAGNSNRIFHNGEAAFPEILKGINVLREHGVSIAGALCVINTNVNARSTLESLDQLDFKSIDLLQPAATHDNPPTNPPIGEWWVEAFLAWIEDPALKHLRIRFFEEALQSLVLGHSRSEWFGNPNRDYIVVRSDGSYEGLDLLKVTNGEGRITGMCVSDHSIQDALQHPDLKALSSKELNSNPIPGCESCAIQEWCGGGYLTTRWSEENKFNNPSVYCNDLKKMFAVLAKHVLEGNYLEEAQHDSIHNSLTALGEV